MGERKGTTKSKGKKHSLDKFYTKPEIAAQCIQLLPLKDYKEIIEPSAGNGAFSNQLPNCTAYDIHPESDTITQADWFTVTRTRDPKNPILVIGNPPFGQQNTLAINFINHAAEFAQTIAFILPKSFMKESLHQALNPNLHLRTNLVLPKNSFILDGQETDVPCVFQIWEHQNTIRPVKNNPVYHGFKFVKKTESPHLYLQRVGGKTGTAGSQWQNRSDQSNYFIQLDNPELTEQFISKINNTSFPTKDFSVGPRSISKKEFLIEFLKQHPEYYVN